jgi:hypothetical protein
MVFVSFAARALFRLSGLKHSSPLPNPYPDVLPNQITLDE